MGPKHLKRILVADDTLPMRIMLQDVLNEAGYEVTTAADGQEAWETFQEEPEAFDLLIVDLLMPRMNGFEVLERLRDQYAPGYKKILVITGIFKSQKEVQRLKELGALGYITKTALVDEILFRVNQVFHLGQENSRRFPRLLKSVPIEYCLGEDRSSSYTSNFSAGGAFIRTISPFKEGHSLEARFTIPEIKLPVTVSARVAWTNDYEMRGKKASLPGMGVEFTRIEPELQKAIEDFVRERLAQEPVWFDQFA